MFSDNEILKKLVEEKEVVFPEAVPVFVECIPIDDVPTIEMGKPANMPIYCTYIVPCDGIKNIKTTFKISKDDEKQ